MAAKASGLAGCPFRARVPVAITPDGVRKVNEFSSVVFPAPEDPMIANSSPGYAAPFTRVGRKVVVRKFAVVEVS